MKKLILIEWARGIASILVVLHHATLDAPFFYNYQPFYNFFYFGMAGVDFFFVLSGFIIYYIHSKDNSSLSNIKKYILKRLIRIYPIFIIITFLLLVAYNFMPISSERVNITDISFIIHSFLLLPQSIPPLLTVSWTLVHEMFFYFLFIIFFINKKLAFLTFTIWGILILFLNIKIEHLDFPMSFYFNYHNLEFILGIVIAYFIKNKMYLSSKFNKRNLFFFVILIFLLNGINQDYNLIKFSSLLETTIYGCTSAIIIYLLALKSKTINISKEILLFFNLIGGASYVIYLIHLPILSILHRIILKFHINNFLHPNFIFLIIVSISIIIGILIHIYIEQPILKLLRKKLL